MVSDVEEVFDVFKEHHFPSLDTNVFAHHHQPILAPALVGLIIELRDTFAYQLFVHITFKAHNRLLDPLGLASRFGGNFITSQTLKRLPGILGQGFSQSDYFGMSIPMPKINLIPWLFQRSNSALSVKSVSPRKVISPA